MMLKWVIWKLWSSCIRWVKYRRVKRYCRLHVWRAKSISLEEATRELKVEPSVVHRACKRYVKSGRLQRLRNTPGIDYYPMGMYGSCLRLPHADGKKNPFLNDDGNLKSALLPHNKTGR